MLWDKMHGMDKHHGAQYMTFSRFMFVRNLGNYPQLNTFESPDGDGGWFKGTTGWRGCSLKIFTLTRKYYSTREDEKTLKITDGMEIKYIVTIRQKSTGIKKEYPGTVIVKDKKWD